MISSPRLYSIPIFTLHPRHQTYYTNDQLRRCIENYKTKNKTTTGLDALPQKEEKEEGRKKGRRKKEEEKEKAKI